jgi:hypothetical protein
LENLSTIVRNQCRLRDVDDARAFTLTTTPTPAQRQALTLIRQRVAVTQSERDGRMSY